ncbi:MULTISPECIES: DoxX family membrane protein [Streptomyces]|jgi:putative oxidoreductase|uniref:DoxX family protein n=1 Tax=Streptomyces thermogriseus TaxID=75292 RepID=A0ABP4DLH6_9ACTN|nr:MULTISPECIES: DoxX family membrane protein [Streptomyces]MDN5383154.1 DoxX family membrane protein [Streptomyces sp. LB8]
MSLLRVAGRPLLASMFVAGGLEAVRRPEAVTSLAEPVVRRIGECVTVLPERTEEVVRLNGGVQVAAGVLLGLGRLPRLSALVLAVSLVPTTVAAHRFWEVEDTAERVQQQVHFLKNMSMLGGLLIAADDTGAAPSLLWRGRHAGRELRREARLVRRSVQATARPAVTVGGMRARLGKLSA